jgi:hypothetical protein
MRQPDPASQVRSTPCTSTRSWHAVVMGKTRGALPANSARRMILFHLTNVLSPRGRRWSTTARRLQQHKPTRSSTRYRLRRFRRRVFRRALTTSSTG